MRQNSIVGQVIKQGFRHFNRHVARGIEMGMGGIRHRTVNARQGAPIGQFNHEVASGQSGGNTHITTVALRTPLSSGGKLTLCRHRLKSRLGYAPGKTMDPRGP